MKQYIEYQQSYSKAQLLLRTFLGWFYILIPFALIYFVYSIWLFITAFIAFWYGLFTGKLWKRYFVTYENAMNMNLRVSASLSNLLDGYPKLWPEQRDNRVYVNFDYNENIGRGSILFRSFLGFIAVFPHSMVIFARTIINMWYGLLNWLSILISGTIPENRHNFIVETYRQNNLVNAYIGYVEDYPIVTIEERGA
jgi:hypothetical protein